MFQWLEQKCILLDMYDLIRQIPCAMRTQMSQIMDMWHMMKKYAMDLFDEEFEVSESLAPENNFLLL